MNEKSANPNLDTNNPLVKSMIESMVQRGRDANSKNTGEKVHINNFEGNYTPASVNGKISDV